MSLVLCPAIPCPGIKVSIKYYNVLRYVYSEIAFLMNYNFSAVISFTKQTLTVSKTDEYEFMLT